MDVKQTIEYAKTVASVLKREGHSQAKLTERLGCGCTLVCMYTGKKPTQATSGLTEYVLRSLCNIVPAVMNDKVRKKAMAAYPSGASVINELGASKVVELTEVSQGTIYKWKSELDDLWTPVRNPRIAVAALRIMAIKLSEKSKHPELELDLFGEHGKDVKPKKKFRRRRKTSKPESKPESKPDGRDAQTMFRRKTVSEELSKLADAVRNFGLKMPPSDIEKVMAHSKSIGDLVKKSIEARKKELDELASSL